MHVPELGSRIPPISSWSCTLRSTEVLPLMRAVSTTSGFLQLVNLLVIYLTNAPVSSRTIAPTPARGDWLNSAPSTFSFKVPGGGGVHLSGCWLLGAILGANWRWHASISARYLDPWATTWGGSFSLSRHTLSLRADQMSQQSIRKSLTWTKLPCANTCLITRAKEDAWQLVNNVSRDERRHTESAKGQLIKQCRVDSLSVWHNGKFSSTSTPFSRNLSFTGRKSLMALHPKPNLPPSVDDPPPWLLLRLLLWVKLKQPHPHLSDIPFLCLHPNMALTRTNYQKGKSFRLLMTW